jgi:hypothetical protein
MNRAVSQRDRIEEIEEQHLDHLSVRRKSFFMAFLASYGRSADSCFVDQAVAPVPGRLVTDESAGTRTSRS